ncbi:unnamed protein product [Timema podura]|uniref:Cytochrome c oxidase assembly protein COX16 homolog, mitochondrial n=1 Tax=Timema podura TaxID=61482 RepID=A0ABN7P919_TIMPD|nr:unnamed protein product [Timema podura]
MNTLLYKFRQLSEQKFFRYGVPFLIFMVGGSFGLKEFTQLRRGKKKLRVKHCIDGVSRACEGCISTLRDYSDGSALDCIVANATVKGRQYEFRKNQKIDPKDVEESHGIKMKKRGEVTLESEYEKLKELDIDNWSNIRGPRPWETPEEQVSQKLA